MVENLSREDVDRLMFFEQAREQAENDVQQNGRDAQALTRWGGALLELAHFRQGEESYTMIAMAVDKFKQAIDIDSSRHDAQWCLGNAYTSQGFLTPDGSTAEEYFDQAASCFDAALELDPSNEIYRKAKEMTKKAPELHSELQRQLAAQGESVHLGGGGSGGGGNGGGRSASATVSQGIGEFWYDVAGWGLLVALGFGIVALAKHAPQPGAAQMAA